MFRYIETFVVLVIINKDNLESKSKLLLLTQIQIHVDYAELFEVTAVSTVDTA